MALRIFIGLLLVNFGQPIFSQHRVVKFKHITHEAFANTEILDIYQDQQDFIWVANFDGLHKYSPRGVKSFHPDATDTTSVSSSTVNVITDAPNNNMWLGTGFGLNLFDPSTEKFITYGVDSSLGSDFLLPHHDVRSVLQTGPDTVWLGTPLGIAVFNPRTGIITRIKDATGLGGRVINTLFAENDQYLWVATEDSAVSRIDRKTMQFRHYSYSNGERPGVNYETVNCFFKDSANRLWIGTWNYGFKYYDQELDSIVSPRLDTAAAKKLAFSTVRTIHQKDEHHLWIGTFYSGLFLYDLRDGSAVQHLPAKHYQPDQLSSAMIWQLEKDRHGNLWIGTFGGGLHLYNPRQHTISHFKANLENGSGILSNEITAIVVDHQRDIWLGTPGQGLSRYNPTTEHVRNYLHASRNRSGHIRTLFVDQSGRVWAGTEAGALYYSPEIDDFIPLTNVKYQPEKTGDWPCYDIDQDTTGNMWFGYYAQGLHRLDATAVSSNHPENGELTKIYGYGGQDFPGTSTYIAYIDRQNRLWMQRERHLIVVDLATEAILMQKETRFSQVYQDPSNRIWLAGYDGQLFDFQEFDQSFHLVLNTLNTPITGLLADSLDRLWIFSYEGMNRFDPHTDETVSYNELDGLQHNHIHYNSSKFLNPSEIIIGGKNGYNIYNPYTVQKHSQQPKIQLTDFQLFNKSITLDKALPEDLLIHQSISQLKELELTFDQNVITIEFCALNYSAPETVQYRYQLLGFDPDYRVAPKGSYSATFTNLDPGTYRLRYEATDSNNNWIVNDNLLKIVVLPPYWQTWWFRTFVGLLFIGCLITWNRLRLKRVRRKFQLQQAEQERAIVKLRNDKLRQELAHKNAELTGATMNVIRRNNAIQHIQNRLTELTEKLPDAHKGRFKLFLKQLNKQKKQEMSWDEFVSSFDATHNDFIQRFRSTFPQLTQKDLKLCAYLRMDLTNHDIASLLNVSLRSVETTRYRIRQKIDMQSKDTLSEFILKF